MKQKLWWLLLIIPVILALFFFIKNRVEKTELERTASKVVFNSITQKWEKQIEDEVDQKDRESILSNLKQENNDMDGLYNPAVFKGYFDHYDPDEQFLTIKAVVPFTNGLFEFKKAKLLANQTIYCTPATYIDPNTGQAYETKNIELPVLAGETLSFHVEKIIDFSEFISQSTAETFLHIQLTTNYDENKTNYVQKILVIGLCE